MLIAGALDAIVNKIAQGIMWFFLKLDAIVYNLVCWFYEIFLFLAKINLFNYEDYNNIVKRIYIVLGVIMLFILSYSLLRAVINPDEFAKGENSFPNIIKNVIVSLVIITVLPTVFDVAFRVQAVILNSDVIGKLILSDNFSTSVVSNGGHTMASTVFRAFIRVDENIGASSDYASEAPAIENHLNEAFTAIEQGQSFMIFTNGFTDSYNNSYSFPELIVNNAIDYTYIVSTAAGVFILWTVLLFCFDLGIRAIKLIYYQLIAPVAVVCRVLPGKKAKPVFDNWLKYTISTFIEVFIRIFVMYLGVYLIRLVKDRMGDIFSAATQSNLGTVQKYFVMAFLVMGIVAFIRQAPKLIQDVFGFESGGLNLGFKKAMAERLGAGGALAAAGLVGGAAGGFGQRLRDAQAAGRHGWRAAASAFAGGIGGGRRAFMRNLGSKSMDDFRKNTTEGINDTLERGRKNDQERAQFGNKFRAKGNAVKEFLGVNPNVAALDRSINAANSIVSAHDAVKNFTEDIVNKNKANSAFTASLSAKDYTDKGMDAKMAEEFANLFNGQSLATIEQEINRMKVSAGKPKDIEAMRQNYIEKIKQEKIKELQAAGHSMDTIQQTINSSMYAKMFEQRANDYVANISKSNLEESQRISQYEAMYNQLFKASVENAADQMASNHDFGGAINEGQMQNYQNLLETERATIDNSQLPLQHTYDKSGDSQFSSLDDVSKEAQKISYEEAAKKQRIIQNQSKGS